MIKRLKSVIKGLLDDPNDTNYKIMGGQWLSFHDRTHLEVARLQRVEILGQAISGIDGICIPEFHNEKQIPNYDGLLDECRVGLHQWVSDPLKPIFLLRAGYWCGWLLLKGENPLRVVVDHWVTTR